MHYIYIYTTYILIVHRMLRFDIIVVVVHLRFLFLFAVVTRPVYTVQLKKVRFFNILSELIPATETIFIRHTNRHFEYNAQVHWQRLLWIRLIFFPSLFISFVRWRCVCVIIAKCILIFLLFFKIIIYLFFH